MRNLFGSKAWVYLARYSNEDIYKIGWTDKVNERLAELNISFPHRVQIVFAIATNEPRQVEKYWHDRFAKQRRPGSGIRTASEWFDLSDDDVREFMTREAVTDQVDEESDSQQILTFEQEQDIRANAVQRVVNYYGDLARKNPQCLVKLVNSCNAQIYEINERVIDLQNDGKDAGAAIKSWEARACRAADRKIERFSK